MICLLRFSRLSGASAVALLLLAGSARAQSVHVLTNGSGAQLQQTIDAAADGDTILLHGGSFTDVHVIDRSLTIASEPEQSTTIQVLDVANLSAGKRLSLVGLRLVGSDAAPVLLPPIPPKPALNLANCAGSVRLEHVHCLPFVFDSGADALRVSNCTDVAVLHGELFGGTQRQPYSLVPSGFFGPGIGLTSSGASQVAVYETTILGGDGAHGTYVPVSMSLQEYAAREGAAGVRVNGGTFFAARTLISGGAGGAGTPGGCTSFGCPLAPVAGTGANGGVGLSVASGPQVLVADASLAGGAGGAGGVGATCSGGACGFVTVPAGTAGPNGAASAGALSTLGGPIASLSATTLVRELQTIAFDVTGTPGDVVILGLSTNARFLLDPGLQGVQLCGPGLRRFAAGTIPASGVLHATLPAGLLPFGVEGSTRYVQVFARDPSNVTRLGGPAVVTTLATGF